MKKIFLVFLSLSLFILGCSDEDGATFTGQDTFSNFSYNYSGTCIPSTLPSLTNDIPVSYVCTEGVSSTLTLSGVSSSYVEQYIELLNTRYGAELTESASAGSWSVVTDDFSLYMTYSGQTLTMNFEFYTSSESAE